MLSIFVAQVGTVESVKAVSDIYSPVSGEVVDVNEKLADEPSLINTSPEQDGMLLTRSYYILSNASSFILFNEIGWLAKIKLSNKEQLDSLLDEAAYKAHCEGEEDH